jgi:hypothetical protein
VVVRLGITEAMVLVVGDLSMFFLGRWCHIVVEAIGGFRTLVVVGIGGVVSVYVAEVGVVGWCCFGDAAARVEAPTLCSCWQKISMVYWSSVSLTLSVNMLPFGFSAPNYCLAPCDDFLFLTKPLDLLLDSTQLLLFYSFVFKGFIFLVLHLNLLELCIILNDLNWRRCPQR